MPDVPSKAVNKPTWEEAREAYSKMTQMGWQAVQQAALVGQMLMKLKKVTPYREFRSRVAEIGIAQTTSSRLMRLAEHRSLLEKHKPESQAAALALIPKKKAQGGRPEGVPASKNRGMVAAPGINYYAPLSMHIAPAEVQQAPAGAPSNKPDQLYLPDQPEADQAEQPEPGKPDQPPSPPAAAASSPRPGSRDPDEDERIRARLRDAVPYGKGTLVWEETRENFLFRIEISEDGSVVFSEWARRMGDDYRQLKEFWCRGHKLPEGFEAVQKALARDEETRVNAQADR